MVKNPAVDEVQEVRQRLIEQFGGLKGYTKHLLEFENTLDVSKKVVAPPARAKRKAADRKVRKPTSRSNATATASKRTAKRKAS